MADKPIVYDLDVLRPVPEYVLLAGKKIDISFIPSGVAIDLMGVRQQMDELVDTPEKLDKIKEGGEEALKSFQLSAEMCAKITECQYKEMDKEWLLKNTNVAQLQRLIKHITDAIFRSIESTEGEPGKN
ncbi:hypothetical protein LCGC14_1981760 [marine sediment metagenome]|uniref:Tail assembly chaperone n=1 Tax=marine sediment metagenome TaxID=412755 RepID=A0A0F9FWV3_9ZZZZ